VKVKGPICQRLGHREYDPIVMTALASKWMIVLLACGVSLGALAPSVGAEATPPPPPASPRQGGQEGHEGGEVRGNFVTMLTLVLNLTSEQQTQVKAIFEATSAQAKAINDDPKLSPSDKTMKVDALREAMNAKIRPLLTPDQQKNFDELQKQLAQGRSKPQPAPATPPAPATAP